MEHQRPYVEQRLHTKCGRVLQREYVTPRLIVVEGDGRAALAQRHSGTAAHWHSSTPAQQHISAPYIAHVLYCGPVLYAERSKLHMAHGTFYIQFGRF